MLAEPATHIGRVSNSSEAIGRTAVHHCKRLSPSLRKSIINCLTHFELRRLPRKLSCWTMMRVSARHG